MSNNIVTRAMEVLANNPTSADLDFLVTAHGAVGYLAAQAETEAEQAEAERKYHEAQAYLTAKRAGEKVSDVTARTIAEVEVRELKQDEVEAFGKARKLKNILSSITEAINAIKFLGRYDSAVNFPKGR